MTDPKPSSEAKGETDAGQSLPSRAREAGPDLTDAPTLTDAEVSAANAAYQVRFKRVEDLIPYARNSRTHSDAQIAQLAASMVEFGFVGAILADEQGIVAGHGRVMAARRLYAAGKRLKAPNGALIPVGCVPWVDCTGWTEAQRKAFVIWDNRSAELAGWNNDLLRIEFDDLKALDFNLDLTGFDSKALDAIMSPAGDDDAPADTEGEGADDASRIINCPKCGHDFSVLEQMTTQAKRRKPKKAA